MTKHKTPGQLLTRLLEERGWSKRVLGVVLGISDAAVNKLASDKQKFTAEIALALEEVLGEPADSFLELQKQYDLAVARLKSTPDPGQAYRAELFSQLPISAMIKRGWIEAQNVRDLQNVEKGLCALFDVENPREIKVSPHAAKKTEVAAGTSLTQAAWLVRVRRLASEMNVPPYSKRSAEHAIEQLKPLLVSPEAAQKVPLILTNAGIRFVVVESLPSAKIDGVCTWLDSGKAPVIGMSLRFDRIDNFWFVLRHELEHVLRGDGKDEASIDIDLKGEQVYVGDSPPKQELIANQAALEFAIPKTKMDAFIARTSPVFSETDLIGFARSIGVHEGLVAGQLQFRTQRWNLFRQHLVKIRSNVCASAIVDGWGTVAPVNL